ncbi:MAG: YwiC-like family protein [Vicinamibacterales bacterium]
MSLRSVLLPRDHGSWSFVLEPVALGLIAAPSVEGAAIALGGLALFLTRRPMQIVRAADGRRWLALQLLAVLVIVALASLGYGLWFGGGTASVALLAAVPLAAAFQWFDTRKAAREAAAELCGAFAFAAFAAAIVLAAGRPASVGAMLSGFAAARALASIVPIRTYLRRRKGQAVARWPSVVAPLVGLAAFAGVGAVTGYWWPAAWMVAFTLRAAWLLGPWAPAWTATRVGVIETIIGAAAVLTVGMSA